MPAATPAFSDSVRAAIGMRTSTSQAWATIRDRPRPSDPMTRTSGAVARSRSRIPVSPAASRPADEHPGVPVGLQGAGQVGRASHRHPGQGARGRLPGARRDAGAAAARDDHPVGAERGRRARHRAQVARVGDTVQGGDQR